MTAGALLCFLLTAQAVIHGIAVDHQLEVYSNIINVTIGQSALLPVTYTLHKQFSMYTVEWITQDRAVLYYQVTNCSTNPQGFPTWSRGKIILYQMYKGRVEFYTLNASLLLYDLQTNDSGTYTIKFSTAGYTSKKEIRVWVQASLSSGEDGARRWSVWIFALRTVLGFLPIAGLLAIYYIWGC